MTAWCVISYCGKPQGFHCQSTDCVMYASDSLCFHDSVFEQEQSKFETYIYLMSHWIMMSSPLVAISTDCTSCSHKNGLTESGSSLWAKAVLPPGFFLNYRTITALPTHFALHQAHACFSPFYFSCVLAPHPTPLPTPPRPRHQALCCQGGYKTQNISLLQIFQLTNCLSPLLVCTVCVRMLHLVSFVWICVDMYSIC